MSTYKIVRFFQKGGNEVVTKGLTLEQAQAHCNDPETSSTTATGEEAVRRTQERGAWFDGYRESNRPPRKPGLLEQGLEILARERRGQ